jgi:hypothetical protein
MNANKKTKTVMSDKELNLSLINLEKVEPISLWQKLKKSFSTPEPTIHDWERIESKPCRHKFEEYQWRNF